MSWSNFNVSMAVVVILKLNSRQLLCNQSKESAIILLDLFIVFVSGQPITTTTATSSTNYNMHTHTPHTHSKYSVVHTINVAINVAMNCFDETLFARSIRSFHYIFHSIFIGIVTIPFDSVYAREAKRKKNSNYHIHDSIQWKGNCFIAYVHSILSLYL